MPKVTVTVEDEAYIRERIERFSIEAPATQQWLRPYVREHGALPLYIGWTETFGIKPDGTVVRWSTEGDWQGVRDADEKTWVIASLVQGAEQYPALRRLIPVRAAGALPCESCGGLGRLAQTPQIICVCGGVGWVANRKC
jgi:hypothetical protein